jgi:prepilin-type N-terminal cleavage/methylation domain-containing protein
VEEKIKSYLRQSQRRIVNQHLRPVNYLFLIELKSVDPKTLPPLSRGYCHSLLFSLDFTQSKHVGARHGRTLQALQGGTMRTRTARAFTLIELLVVVAIIGVLIALLLPAAQAAREAARRVQCQNHLREIGLGLHNYASQYGVLPPGAILAGYPDVGTTDFDPWPEATSTVRGRHGTSWMLQILPFIEQQALYDRWDFTKSVAVNQAVAATDISTFFCPTRRVGTRLKDRLVMFPYWAGRGTTGSEWLKGGNDYAGCMGAQNAFTNPTTSNSARKFCGPTYVFEIPPTGTTPTGTVICLRGIFVPNHSVRLDDIADGQSTTIVIGEVPRNQWIGSTSDAYWGPCHTHIDGWAIAGPNTLFDTAKPGEGTDKGQTGGFNNDYFESAGSDHNGGAFFGIADGSVRFISEDINSIVYANLGSMADAQPTVLP